MKFAIVEVQEGGAIMNLKDEAQINAYLQSEKSWQEAARLFVTTVWLPGSYMSYPNGWIFCVVD